MARPGLIFSDEIADVVAQFGRQASLLCGPPFYVYYRRV
jgi:hypothetical protein